MRRANYEILKDEPDMLLIRDIGPWTEHPTVTNDAEGVVEDLAKQGRMPAGRRLVYYDSEGELDEILVKDGKFVGFAPFRR